MGLCFSAGFVSISLISLEYLETSSQVTKACCKLAKAEGSSRQVTKTQNLVMLYYNGEIEGQFD